MFHVVVFDESVSSHVGGEAINNFHQLESFENQMALYEEIIYLLDNEEVGRSVFVGELAKTYLGAVV